MVNASDFVVLLVMETADLCYHLADDDAPQTHGTLSKSGIIFSTCVDAAAVPVPCRQSVGRTS